MNSRFSKEFIPSQEQWGTLVTSDEKTGGWHIWGKLGNITISQKIKMEKEKNLTLLPQVSQ